MVRKRITTVAMTTFLALLMITSALPTVVSAVSGRPDWGVVDPVLQELMGRVGTSERIEVVVQMRGSLTSSDRSVLRSEGLEVIHEFHIVPAVWARATPSMIERLASYDRTFWIEQNERLDYLMERTTAVVNATRAWNAIIEGSLWGSSGIDGSGVSVVVLDSGIDAGHPDLDYGTKTILNLKSDDGRGPWVAVENGDTSSGHGTHCAGTVAGNGDASAGSRRGVAPGANLIGLSAGELIFITGGLGGLEWVYDHSRPGNNPYNIRVVSNSWGGSGGQYNPQDAISQAINRLVYENNVVVVFAAGNSGGTGDDIQSSNYGNTPAAICVAAADHEGTGITDFSSRGQWDWVDTWPDVSAPGLEVMSTAARRTLISTMARGDPDANPYYLAISGTSMATPHVAGLTALLWQAAPHLRVSEVRQDAGVVSYDGDDYSVGPPQDEDTYGTLPYGYEEWTQDALDTRIHEAELIIKLTTTYMPAEGEPQSSANGLTGNFIPEWSVPGFIDGRLHDFSQGYGLINVHRAVGLALALEKLRTTGHPEATVLDAFSVFEPIFVTKEVARNTDMLTTHWEGEWTRFNEQGGREVFTTNQTRYVYIPEGASNMTITLSYSTVDVSDRVLSTLGTLIDWDDDGQWDHISLMTPTLNGVRTEQLTLSGEQGRYARFGIQGRGFRVQRLIESKQFEEVRVEYALSITIGFPSGAGTIVVPEQDPHAIVGNLRLSEPSVDYAMGNVSVEYDVYDLSKVVWSPPAPPSYQPEEAGATWPWLLALLVVALLGGVAVARARPGSAPGRLVISTARAVRADRAISLVYRAIGRVGRRIGSTRRRAEGS